MGFNSGFKGLRVKSYSGKPIGPILKDQEEGADRSSRNVSKEKKNTTRCVTTQKSTFLSYFAVEV